MTHEIEPAFTTASLGEEVILMCNISYPSSQDLTDASPTLDWLTELTNVDPSTSSQVTTEDAYLVSVLNLTSVNSNHCGVYTCAAEDMFVAQPSNLSARVEVGKSGRVYAIVIILC